MNRYIEANSIKKLLVWVPVLLHPLSVHASRGGVPPVLEEATKLSSQPVIEVPRREERDVPHVLQNASDVGDKQRLFVSTLLPLLLMENEVVEAKRKNLLKYSAALARGEKLIEADANWLRELATRYRVKGDPLTDAGIRNELLRRVDIVPVDLALAQAATETGWGASYGARKDRDLFGMTAIRSNRTMKTASGRTVRAPKFSSLREAVRTYVHNLNSHDAYNSLRTIRAKLRKQSKPIQGGAVADGLTKYSTRGVHYVKQIRTVINQHNLNRYVNAKLLPSRDQVVSLDTRAIYAN
jgi:Bax protein